ncbi:hypothetical protein [uncultured Bacteroides sp.]|uniref:hypothetical protein n=1 Tax=uncultured Bacteroides sp. TaxID=162156 RepID=UPI0026170038|nr:hypothetical protein [uncultured Bacteroides sp.]
MSVYNYYKSYFMKICDAEAELRKSRSLYCRNLLFASGSLFGILVSLHHTTGASLPCRLSFFLALLTLGLGILALAIALSLDKHIQARLVEGSLDELKRAIDDLREANDVPVVADKVFVRFEIIGYICLLLSVIFLCVYEFFVSFPELFTN